MIPWNNVYLVPIVLVGGLIAFFFGRTIVGGLIRAWGRMTAHKPAVTATIKADEAVIRYLPEPMPERTTYAPEPPRRRSMADRYEDIGETLLSLEDAREQEFLNLVALDKRKQRMDNALAAARRQSGDNALKGAYVDNRSGGTVPN